MNLNEWIASGQQAELSRLMADPTIRMALRIVSESIPVPVAGNGTKESDIIFAAGITAGYSLCLENLRKLSSSEVQKEVEAKFEPEY